MDVRNLGDICESKYAYETFLSKKNCQIVVTQLTSETVKKKLAKKTRQIVSVTKLVEGNSSKNRNGFSKKSNRGKSIASLSPP